jgi:hypothetical protein
LPFIAGAAKAKPTQLAKLSSETWTEPVQVPGAVCAVSEAVVMAEENVTRTFVEARPVPPSAGVVLLTAGGAMQAAALSQ